MYSLQIKNAFVRVQKEIREPYVWVVCQQFLTEAAVRKMMKTN